MASRGFLIRFIDIGLIVLFGFLMISDIEASSRVDLAGAAPDTEVLEEPREEEERSFIVVEVAADGRFVVYEPAPDGGVEVEALAVETPAELTVVLRAKRAEHETADRETVVMIEPSPASLVQRTVDVMDVCDRLGLPKSLRMDIEVAAAEPGEEGSR